MNSFIQIEKNSFHKWKVKYRCVLVVMVVVVARCLCGLGYSERRSQSEREMSELSSCELVM